MEVEAHTGREAKARERAQKRIQRLPEDREREIRVRDPGRAGGHVGEKRERDTDRTQTDR